jgi:hypothetical protein
MGDGISRFRRLSKKEIRRENKARKNRLKKVSFPRMFPSDVREMTKGQICAGNESINVIKRVMQGSSNSHPSIHPRQRP